MRVHFNPPKQVILLDDVLTTGCSFIVCKAIIAEAWPAADIFGLFVARRVIDRSSLFDRLPDMDF
jgi:predicted amidophosphoribosyltransferase